MKKFYLVVALFCVLFGHVEKYEVVDAAEISPKQQKNGQIHAEYRKINPEEALGLIREASDRILLDVRTEAEYREIRIPGAKLLPVHEIAVRAKSELPDKNIPILVYCRSGRRSETAAKELVNLGYTKVYDMGGIMDWPYEKERK